MEQVLQEITAEKYAEVLASAGEDEQQAWSKCELQQKKGGQ